MRLDGKDGGRGAGDLVGSNPAFDFFWRNQVLLPVLPTRTVMLSLVLLVVPAHECEFSTFRASRFACVEGGRFPEYQHPRLCARDNAYVPSVFSVHNRTDGAEWRLGLEPERSFRVRGETKHPMYEFRLTKFACASVDEYELVVTVQPVQERTPDEQVKEFVWLLVLVLCLILLCACGCASDSDSAFLGGLVTGMLVHEDDHAKFE